MARDPEPETLDTGALAWQVRLSFLAVDAAIPLPFVTAGVAEAGPADEHLMELRAIAFAAVLDRVLDSGCLAAPADLAALEQGKLPAWERES